MFLVKLLVLPLILHVLLVALIGWKMLSARIRSVRSGQTKLDDIAVNADAWPRKVRQVGNNFDNQFQVPNLWYGCVAVIIALGVTDTVFVALSWLFLLTRIVHSSIHLGANNVPTRMRVFLTGFVLLIGMWVWLAVRLALLG